MTKYLRKVYQLLFFSFTAAIFSGAIENQGMIDFYNSFHIFPAVSNIAAHGVQPFWPVTLLVLACSLFIGRFYCSFLCPVGFLQDLGSALGKKMKTAATSVKSRRILSLFIIGYCACAVLSESSLWGWFDHFTNFGRIYNNLVRPSFNGLLLPFASILNKTSFQIDELSFIFKFDFFYALALFLALFIGSMYRPRWFCILLCPSGVIFSFLFNNSFFKIIKDGKCPACHKCEKCCPALSINDGAVDRQTCVTCLECIPACPFGTIKGRIAFDLKNEKPDDQKLNAPRRKFIEKTAIAAIGITAAGFSEKLNAFTGATGSKTILPPGAVSAEAFFSKCTACHLCASSCPTKVIIPSFLENGFHGLSKPKLDFSRGYCSYECNLCQTVCPNGAINRHDINIKQMIRIGEVSLDTSPKSNCMPVKEGKDCGACAEHCPTGAVYMKRKGDVFIPELRKKYCIGCGICEHACPISENKPIFVKPVGAQKMVPLFKDAKDKDIPVSKNPQSRNTPEPGVNNKIEEFPF
ncbi:MAG TPA: 4Fe-4S dicluster domain-containing protein [Candidatus Wallbacteria bacterium]|nr:4Fe-4S dicluster domain-containing protein [Candidatus Wallbacteria bacterium]